MIYFNTVVMPSNGRWALNMINASTGNTIKNNILIHLGSRGGIETDSSSLPGLVSNHNILDKISFDDPNKCNLVAEVSCKEPIIYKKGSTSVMLIDCWL